MMIEEFSDGLRQWSPDAPALARTIAQSRDLLLKIIDSAPIRVFWKGRDLRYLGCNAAFARDAGMTHPKEIVGKDDSQMGWAAQADRYRADEQVIMASGVSKLFYEEQRTARGGQLVWLRTSKVPLVNQDNETFGLLGVYEDITERKRTDVQLEQSCHQLAELVLARSDELAQARDAAEAAGRAKRTFLSHMSHELRTPMNSIMGMTHLALRRAIDPQQIDFLSKSMVASKHLLDVINDLLDISLIEAERLTLDEGDFSLAQLIEDTLNVQERPAQIKGLQLCRDVSLALPDQLCGDALRLKQILLNFIGNAIKFSEHGTITVQARVEHDDGHHVVFRFGVTDQGIGVSPEQQDRLFLAFTQLDDSLTRKHGGTGLGLAIAKRLANLMGGEVGVLSEMGVGSTFWATVRLVRAAPRALPPG